MSEFQPQEPTEIQFSLGKHEFSFTPADAPRVFTHEDPQYDHLFYVSKWHNGQPKEALMFFRELFEQHGIDMDEMLELFIDEDVQLVPQVTPTDFDVDMYEQWSETKRNHPITINILPSDVEDEPTIPPRRQIAVNHSTHSPVPTYELTDRHEDIIQRFGKSLHEITERYPVWFWQEMNEPHDRPYPNRWV